MGKRRAALAALLPAVVLAACGGNGLTAGQLDARATAICVRTAQATDRIPVPSTPAQGDRFLKQGLARLRPAVAELHGLAPPDRLRPRYARAVHLAGQEVALIARHERAIGRGQDVADTYRALQRALTPLLRDENAYWRGLGIPACVRR